MSVVTDRDERSKGKRQTRIETVINLSPEREMKFAGLRGEEKKERTTFNMRTKEEDGICMQAVCCSLLQSAQKEERTGGQNLAFTFVHVGLFSPCACLFKSKQIQSRED